MNLAPGVTSEALLARYSREQFEAEPYRLALIAMGSEGQDGPGGNYLSNDIWHFDTECIEDHGSYAAIARRLQTLAHGKLALEAIADHVDIDAGDAWLAFRIGNEEHRWSAEVQDDWVDPTILSRFARLLEAVGSGRRFTYIDLGGQDCLIGCSTADERTRLAKETGLKVDWLT
jgi:hypothetical protein